MNSQSNSLSIATAQDAEQFILGIVKAIVDAAMHAGANLSSLAIQIAVGRLTLVLIARCKRRDAEIRLRTIKEIRKRAHNRWKPWPSLPIQLELDLVA
jgi:hypothetical protein